MQTIFLQGWSGVKQSMEIVVMVILGNVSQFIEGEMYLYQNNIEYQNNVEKPLFYWSDDSFLIFSPCLSLETKIGYNETSLVQ